ncbi:MAG: hypothetical protein MR497_01460 [Bacilli bacterium]|nr:hypothetical protein [Bacilli bacterium]
MKSKMLESKADDLSKKFQASGPVIKGVAAKIAANMVDVSTTIVSVFKKLIEYTKEVVAYADILTQSQVTGIATFKLPKYMYAAWMVDVSVDTLTGSMEKQIKSMKSVQSGFKTIVEAYMKLEIEIMNAEGLLRDSDKYTRKSSLLLVL